MEMFVLLLMIFLHIWDDFGRQGIMASMKQRDWWKNQPEYSPIYVFDYAVALFMHSFSWAFMIMLPIFFMCNFNLTVWHCTYFVANALIHMWVDDLKANQKVINLIVDQSVHLCQIGITWLVFVS